MPVITLDGPFLSPEKKEQLVKEFTHWPVKSPIFQKRLLLFLLKKILMKIWGREESLFQKNLKTQYILKGGRKNMILKGKIALVTGASRGIGAATAKKLAEHGASVAVNYNTSEEKAQNVVDILTKNGSTAIAVKANVFDQVESEQMVRQVEKQLGKIDILVLNAGANFKMAPFMEQSWEDFENKILRELKGSYWTVKAVLPSMIERKSGTIIIVSSGLSRKPGYGFSTHTTAKSALDGFAKSMALELGPMGIRVNVIAPGLTLTDATSFMPQAQIDAAAGFIPLRRIGLPEDIAGAVLFYSSDESKYITGNYLSVGGGQIML